MRYRLISLFFSKESLRSFGLFTSSCCMIVGYGIMCVGLMLGIGAWMFTGYAWAMMSKQPPAQKELTFQERMKAQRDEMYAGWERDRQERERHDAQTEAEREKSRAELAALAKEAELAAANIPKSKPSVDGWEETFDPYSTPIEACRAVEKKLAEKTAELAKAKKTRGPSVYIGSLELDIRMLKKDVDFLKSLPKRPPPKSVMEAEVKRRSEEHKAFEQNMKRNDPRWVEKHTTEGLLELQEVSLLKTRHDLAYVLLLRWPMQ